MIKIDIKFEEFQKEKSVFVIFKIFNKDVKELDKDEELEVKEKDKKE